MGEYNPDAGLIVGQEWVPILSDPYVLRPDQELGWSFTLANPVTVNRGTIYVSEPVVDSHISGLNHDFAPIDLIYTMMNIYPEGAESDTGPMRQTIVEVSGATTSGSGTGFTLDGLAPSLMAALYRPGDHFSATADPGTAESKLFMTFNFNGHPELDGKRIVKIEFVYTIETDSSFGIDTTSYVRLFQDFGSPAVSSTATSVPLLTSSQLLAQSGFNFDTFPAVPLPNLNIIVDGPVPPTFPIVGQAHQTDCFPWTYDKLKLLDAGAGVNQQTLELRVQTNATATFSIFYAALRVTYCEERRVAVGGQAVYITPNSSNFGVRDIGLAPSGAVLPAGRYTLTIEGGTLDTELFAARELRQLPGQKGLLVSKTDRLGQAFTSETTDQMVMLSLHTDPIVTGYYGDIIPGPHAYGPQLQADSFVWPDATQTRQGIINASMGGTVDYPTARFYARRFGDTSAPLELTSETNPAITAQITVDEFDALPEITNGWKEITLTYSAPVPTFDNSGTVSTYYWRSNTGVGAPWQVLGASAYSQTGDIPYAVISGLESQQHNTYGDDTAFITISSVDQPAMDASLMFAQAMPAVSGLALELATLPVSGIGLDCGVPPGCVPTGISYNALTWDALSAASMPASGFGYYELQRSDDVDTTWYTILQATSPLVTGYSDFEPRVGVLTSYRMRFVHHMDFPSAWSPVVTGTVPAPGVTGTHVADGVLIFTTNERQTGNSNLAYAMAWQSGSPTEDFTFVESGDVVLQKMYGRDYQVAFRPLERGGERFTRDMLVQAAAVPDGLMEYGFTSLRDLAWEDVSYVCVRDELGDKWLATVIVPTGTVQRDRQLYIAQVDIVEVTATPSVVTLPDSVMGPASGPGAGCLPALWDSLPGWDYGCWSD